MPKLHRKLYDQVFDAILRGEIAPGTRLSEETLANLYGVSRSVVRRTLQRLFDEGIVDIRPNRGASVRSVDADDARSIFEARRVVETGIVELACGQLSGEQIRDLREIVRREDDAMRAGDRTTGLRLSAEFHLALSNAAGNPMLARYAGNLMSRSALAVACLERREPAHCAWGEHGALLDALEAGDAATARRRMQEHLEHIAANLELDDPATPPLESVLAG